MRSTITRLLAFASSLLLAGSMLAASAEAQVPFAKSFYRQALPSNAALDPQSPALVDQLTNLAYGLDPDNQNECRATIMKHKDKWTEQELVDCEQVTYSASIQRDQYAPSVYEVPASQPRVPVILDNNAPQLSRALDEGVPIPPDAIPAGGSDGQLVIHQPATDTMWEFWRATKDSSGAWHARWGGRIENASSSPGYYQDVRASGADGLFSQQHSWGETATSLPNLPGLIRINELRRGEIDHALNFAIYAPKVGEYVFPAQRGDGRCVNDLCSDIPEGARFRLDPSFDISQIKHPVVRMMAEAIQKYGMVLNNRTGSGLDFYAEGWRPGGENVYDHGEGLFVSDPKQQYPIMFMREFPWERLELLRRGTSCTNSKVACPEPDWWQDQTNTPPVTPPTVPVDPPTGPGLDLSISQVVSVSAKVVRVKGVFNRHAKGKLEIKYESTSRNVKASRRLRVEGRRFSIQVKSRKPLRLNGGGLVSADFTGPGVRHLKARKKIR